MQIREKITSEIEKLRAAGKVGSSLEAAITIKAAKDEDISFLKSVAWPNVAIVSEAVIEKDEAANDVQVFAARTSGSKCPRCWQYRKDIGTDKDHPEVCGRCAAVLNAQEKAG